MAKLGNSIPKPEMQAENSHASSAKEIRWRSTEAELNEDNMANGKAGGNRHGGGADNEGSDIISFFAGNNANGI